MGELEAAFWTLSQGQPRAVGTDKIVRAATGTLRSLTLNAV